MFFSITLWAWADPLKDATVPAPSKDTILVFREELRAASPATYSVRKAPADEAEYIKWSAVLCLKLVAVCNEAEKLPSSPNAAASSLRVFNASGAASIAAATALSA